MKSFFLASFLLLSYFSFSQAPGYTIIYNFTHAIDTNNLGKIHEEMMALTFDKTTSKYFSETEAIQQEEQQRKYDEAEKKGSDNGVYKVDLGVIKKTTNENILLFPKHKKSFLVNSYKSNKYAIVHQIPDFKWKIQKETKTIKGYNCQLAKGYWKGRTYNAWFTTDLPYPFGPWKLNGLPGVILEAVDGTNTVRFECKSINKDNSVTISVPHDAILTSQNEFDKMTKSMQSFSNQLNSDANGSNTVVEQISPASKESTKKKSNGFNNPIEITEK